MNKNVGNFMCLLVDTKLWKLIKRNKTLYAVVHNSIGRIINDRKLKDRIREMKKDGMKCVFEVQEVLCESNIIFFVDFGTLLGFVRDGKPISWDFDIDFGIIMDSEDQWDVLHNAMMNINFKLVRQFSYLGTVTEKTYHRNNIFIDFFRHFSTDGKSYYYVYYDDKSFHYNADNLMHSRITTTVHLSGTKLYEVQDRKKVYVPNEYEQYLVDVYGEDWKIPNPNWNGIPKETIYLSDFGVLEKSIRH